MRCAVKLGVAVRVMGFLLLVACCAWAQNEDENDQNSAQLPGQGLSFQGSPQLKRQKPSSESMLPDAPLAQPITGVDKFQAFVEEARSPFVFGVAGLNALALREAQEHAAPGMQSSFATLYEASVVQRESSAFLGKFLYPSLLKQDPRYYPSTSQSLVGRTAYAASRLLITRNDEGKATVNISYLLGVLTSAAVAMAYRPYWARTSSGIFSDFGSTIGSDAGMNVFHEFWPAIRNKLQGHSPKFVQKIEKFSDHLTGDHAPSEPAAIR